MEGVWVKHGAEAPFLVVPVENKLDLKALSQRLGLQISTLMIGEDLLLAADACGRSLRTVGQILVMASAFAVGDGSEANPLIISVLGAEGTEDSAVKAAESYSTTVLGAAFEYQFMGQGVDKLLSILKQVNDYSLAEWYAHFVVVVNSSGWGKSRTFCEVTSKGIWVFYCSLSTASYSYPPESGGIAEYLRSGIKDRLQARKGDENAYYGQHRVMVFMMAFYAACLVVLNDWIEATRTSETPVEPVTFVKWLRAPREYPQGQHFWDAVQTLMKGKAVPAPTDNQTLPHVGRSALRNMHAVPPPTVSQDTSSDIWAAWEVAKDNILVAMTGELCPELSGKAPKVLFVFDEAKCLAKRIRSAAVPPIVPVRRSVRYLRTGVLAAFVSTNSQVIPPAEASDKVSGRGSKIPPTVYGIYTVSRQPLTCNGKEARNPARLVQIGRPLFKAWYEACLKLKVEIPLREMLELAADKLLGGGGKLAAWKNGWETAAARQWDLEISDAAAIATAGFRLSFDMPACSRRLNCSHG